MERDKPNIEDAAPFLYPRPFCNQVQLCELPPLKIIRLRALFSIMDPRGRYGPFPNQIAIGTSRRFIKDGTTISKAKID